MLPETVSQDLRYAVRMLFRNAGSTFVAVFALALGIGLNTAAFTAWKAMVARPVDARDPNTMMNIALSLQSGETSAWFSYPDYEAYRDHAHSFSGLIAWCADRLVLTGTGGVLSERDERAGSLLGRFGMLPAGVSNKEYASTYLVSKNYLSVLGVPLLSGRGFDSMSRAEMDASPPVLISENYWRKRFGSNPAMLGKTIRLNAAAFTIIGITPRDFTGTNVAAPDFWMPLSLEALIYPESSGLRDREHVNLRVFGRLAPGVGIRQAEAEMTLLGNQLRGLHDRSSDLRKPVKAMVWRASPFPLPLSHYPGITFTLAVIMVATGMVLVIACANVGSLQLARATARQSELVVRLSLGATRGRLIRQLLTESAVIGFIAGAAALPFTWAMLRMTATSFGNAFPLDFGTIVFNVNPDARIFSFVTGISVFAGLFFGLVPAVESSRSALVSTARGQAGTSPIRGRRIRDVLIGAQVAISLVLMIAGSMLIRSAMHALRMETGYDAKHVVQLTLRFPERSRYTPERRLAMVREIRRRIAASTGVTSVTSGRAPDDNNLREAAVSLNGETPSKRNTKALLAYTRVEPDYFATLSVPLLAGSGFERGTSGRVAILSESAARKLWPGQNPVGRSLRLGTSDQYHRPGDLPPDGEAWQVIGMARDTRGVSPDGSDSAEVYLPLPEDRLEDYPVLIRTRPDAATMIRRIEGAVASVDPELDVSASTLADMLRQTPAFLLDSLSAAIASAIGLFGLLLASLGVYGTVSYIAVQRTREIGIRMAVGARKPDILRLMLRESARPVVAGLVAGAILAAGASWALRSVLYGVARVDPVSFGGMPLLFLAIALVATWPPTRRAMRVDPMEALRFE